MAELDQTLLVEPDPRDPALLRRAHQRHGAGTQRAPLGEPDELVPLGGEVEVLGHRAVGPKLGREQRVEQHDAEPAGLEPHVLLLVLIGDVVASLGACAASLAERHRLAGHVLKLDRDVLQDVPHPGAFVLAEPPDESARLAVRAAVLLEAGQHLDQRVDESGAELGRGPLLELTQVELQPDDGEVGIQAGPDIDGTIDDPHCASFRPIDLSLYQRAPTARWPASLAAHHEGTKDTKDSAVPSPSSHAPWEEITR